MSALPVEGDGRRDLTFGIADAIISPYPLNATPCRATYAPETTLSGGPPLEPPLARAPRMVPGACLALQR